jgi:5-methylcytosine-specific restriction protein A
MAVERRTGWWLEQFRARFLARNPLCAMCAKQGYVIAAEEVDHITALTNGGKDFDVDPDNAQGLCKPCHRDKTAADLGYRVRPTIGVDGWPI